MNDADMDDVDLHAWVEHLGAEECWHLLAAAPVGRLGVIVDSAPEIYPVNHAVDEGTIVFRVDPGRMLAGLGRSPAVSFEVDGVDAGERSGWSVLVKGRAAEIDDEEGLRRVDRWRLLPWSVGPKRHWVRITPAEVTGRRLGHGVDDARRA